MNVKVYSRMAVGTLINNGFPENVSVVSFHSALRGVNSDKLRVDYSNVCKEVFYVGVPDITEEGFEEYGYTDDTFFAEAKDLACFIYEVVEKGRDIICQCDFGRGRSAACAAAILEHFEGRGNDIFYNDTYSPNLTIYKKVLQALAEIKAER